MALSEEEKKILEKHIRLRREAEIKAGHFWESVYPQFSNQQKLDYWVSFIYHGMFTQGAATGDPYSEFSREWYEDVKEKEPDFDEILLTIVPRLGLRFDIDLYKVRVGIT